MPEVLDPVSGGLQPLSEWLVPGAGRDGIVEAMDPVLFLPFAAQFQPLELG
jgi:hypothetical protein